MQPTPYLFFSGDCFQAMSLYAGALNGKIGMVLRNSDFSAEDRIPGHDDLVMNMSIVTDGGTIYGSDTSAELYEAPNGFRLHLDTASQAEFDRLYGMLAQDARSVEMEPAEVFWAERFAMFTDRFGTPWMLEFTGSRT